MNKNYIKKILLIYLLINIFIFITIFLARANDIDITADEISVDNNKEIINANGNVLVQNDKIKLRSDNIKYLKKYKLLEASKNIHIQDEYNNNYYSESLISSDELTDISAKNVRIRLKDNSRIVGKTFKKKNELNIIKNGIYTPCNENNYLIEGCPGWKLKAKTVYHDEVTKTMHYDHSVLYVLNVPVLYAPYFSHPDPSVKKRSGFLAPKIQVDDNLGEILSLPYFYNMSENKDLTFTPTSQSTANNYLTTEFRLLNKKGVFNIKANINDNNDNAGTSHYLFADAELESQLNQFEIYVQTTNNDTYMRKNQINEFNVLTSGFTIADSYKGNEFLFETKSFKHLTAQGNNQWEYLYPKLTYNISNLHLLNIDGIVNIKNELLRQRLINKDTKTSVSSEVNIDSSKLDKNKGIVYDYFFDTRLIYHSIKDGSSKSDLHQIRVFPQIGTNISLPLKKTSKNFSQILKPAIMPILAPYNNYTKSITVNNSNVFSKNRTSDLSKWEGGPRINYGTEWFVDYKNKYDGSFILGQSLKINKNKSDTSDEVSDLMTSIFLNFDQNIYTNAEFIIDREKYNINKSNITSSMSFKNIKVKAEYDYISSKFSSASEQIGLGTKVEIHKDLDFVFSGKRDLKSDINIGYETGIYYENDCLAINFNYYRDLTNFKDIEDTRGLSLLITLKPFGSSKTFGKSKTFGPQI